MGTHLDPATCQVDERDHRARLAFAADFASLVVYYDQHNHADGDWRPLLLKDPVILLAAIGQTDVERYQRDFSHYPDAQVAHYLFTLLRSMFSSLDQWVHFLRDDGGSRVLCRFLRKAIVDSLSAQLGASLALQQAMRLKGLAGVDAPDADWFAGLDPLWRTQQARLPQDMLPAELDLPGAMALLRSIYDVVAKVFTQVVAHARQAFAQQADQPTRYPDTALLMAFSRLMAYSQHDMNRLGRQHLDFYYDRVLQQEPRPAQADEVVVCLTLAKNAARLMLPAGTLFPAGQNPDGSTILFTNDEAGQFSQAAVSQVKLLLEAEQDGRPAWFLRLLQQATPAAPPAAHAGAALRPAFAIASPMLFLTGGKRTITIEMALSGDGAPAAAAQLATVDGGAAFVLSTAQGWYPVTPTAPVAGVGGAPGTVNWQFILEADAPAIAPFAQGQDPDGLDSPWPLFKVLLGADAALRQPPVLAGVTIAVDVEGLGGLSLANDASVLPSGAAVQPFGPVPDVGHAFYVGSNECFAKPLTSLRVRLQWDNLPTDLQTYYRPYNIYLDAVPGSGKPVVFRNDAFVVTWALLKHRNWRDLAVRSQLEPTPAAGRSTPLFQPAVKTTAAEDYSNAAASVFEVECDPADPSQAVPALALAALPPLSRAAAGYIRLQLSAPAPAFGHAMYGQVVAATSLHNAQSLINLAKGDSAGSGKAGPTAPVTPVTPAALESAAIALAAPSWLGRAWSAPQAGLRRLSTLFGRRASDLVSADTSIWDMPNPPLSPKLLNVQVDYGAASPTNIPAGTTPYPLAYYHYGDFRNYLAFSAHPETPAGAGPVALYSSAGVHETLYIQLSSAQPGDSLSLYFEIDAAPHAAPAPAANAAPSLLCTLWTGAAWQALSVLGDDTAQLRKNGILQLAIPEAPAAGSPAAGANGETAMMAADSTWLAIRLPFPAAELNLRQVLTQALRLRRTDVGSLAPGVRPWIAPGTIAATRDRFAQLAAVAQPSASFGGVAAEDRASYSGPDSYYARVSRRLRHKDRCGSSDDYVAMAHEACRSLYYAKLVSREAGQVLIGLVNGVSSAAAPDALAPVTPAATRAAIAQFIRQRASAMARIDVCDLHPEPVEICVNLQIAPTANGHAVRQSLDAQLRRYLSPWIAGEGARMDIAQGLHRAELIALIHRHPDVARILSLDIRVAGRTGDAAAPAGTVLRSTAQTVLTSAPQHCILIQGQADLG
jgi:hypothetical protein